MDWFKGSFTGKPHDFHGKTDGFRCRFSQQNQAIDGGAALIMLVLYGDRFKQKKLPSALVHWAEENAAKQVQ